MRNQREILLPQSFYARSPNIVARELLGKILVHHIHSEERAGIIVETEAYFSTDDPANHAANGKTARNAPMYGAPGHAYVYFCYGSHWLVNAVTESAGIPSAVLIRAIEPYRGIEAIRTARGNRPDKQLTNGPGKVCAALGITSVYNSQPLYSGALTIRTQGYEPDEIRQSRRIGIHKGTEIEGRYYIAENQWVSAMPASMRQNTVSRKTSERTKGHQ
jgi:DNA-3-methyladenine glycosylase